MFKVSTASLQTFIDTPNCVLEDRVQYSTVHIPNVWYSLQTFIDTRLTLTPSVIPNSNYVIMVSD
jgi:hypothetical protein